MDDDDFDIPDPSQNSPRLLHVASADAGLGRCYTNLEKMYAHSSRESSGPLTWGRSHQQEKRAYLELGCTTVQDQLAVAKEQWNSTFVTESPLPNVPYSKKPLLTRFKALFDEFWPTGSAWKSTTTKAEVVLESFEGFVDEIRGDTAYVTLKSEFGDSLFGEYSAVELAAKGIREGRRFNCRTIESGGKVRVEFMPIPDRILSAAEEEAICQEIDASIGDDNLDGNAHG